MNNIYSSERSNELKQSVLHLLRKIKSDDDITSFLSLWITRIIYIDTCAYPSNIHAMENGVFLSPLSVLFLESARHD